MKRLLLCWLSAALALPHPPHTPHHAPRPHHHKKSQYSVKQVEASVPTRSHIDRHFDTARKYNGKVPVSLATKLVAVQSAYSVTATPEGASDSYYLCPVTIGDQTFKMDFDTGSSDLWVYSSQIASEAGGKTVYNPTTGRLLPGESWEVTYGSGSSASGVVYADTVRIGGLTVTQQAVEAATALNGDWGSLVADGLVGLAFSSINNVRPDQQKTFFDSAVAQGLGSQLFAVSMKHGQPGSYDFGYLDPNKYTGHIAYFPLSSATYWQISDAYLGETIFDTGTTLMYLPSHVTQQYYAQVSGASNAQGLWTFDCSAVPPDFVFSLGSYQTGVAGAYMNFGRADATNCVGSLQDRDALGIPMNILGDAYLKDKYVVFDVNGGSPRVGIAAATAVTA